MDQEHTSARYVEYNGKIYELLRSREGKPLQFQDKFVCRPLFEKTNINITISPDDVVPVEEDMKGDSRATLLVLNALKIKNAHEYDPLYAISTSNIDVLPHQKEAVYDYMLRAFERRGRLRFLLADDVGAGKTIMTGLLLRELVRRGKVRLVLIVVPALLKEKWQMELTYKFFFENVFILSGKEDIEKVRLIEKSIKNGNETHGIFIVSLDLAKQDYMRDLLSNIDWDLVVFDEAHKLSARMPNKKTQRYIFAEKICKRVPNVLLLTATPHTGHREKFVYLLRLLDEETFNPTALLAMDDEEYYAFIRQHLITADIPIYLRRLKSDFKTLEGDPLIPPREVHTVSFELSEEEMEVYYQLTHYVRFLFDVAKKQKDRRYHFVMLLFQKRFASSIYAVEQSLRRRLEKLCEIKERGYIEERRKKKIVEEFEDEYLSEEEEEILVEYVNPEVVDEEIRSIEEVLRALEIIKGKDTKLSKLVENTLPHIFRLSRDEKIVIFTEYKDTAEYLSRKLKEHGFTVVTITGDDTFQQKLQKLREFRDKCQILVATDAAGEGIDLQFSHILINYDVPWSPVILEQRMGRIHRYGQRKTPTIFNFVATNTAEGRALRVLLDKLEDISRTLGDAIYDIVGEIIENEEQFVELIANAVLSSDWEATEQKISEYISKERVNRVRELTVSVESPIKTLEAHSKSLLSRVVPEYVEYVFVNALELLGIPPKPVDKIPTKKGVPRQIYRLPVELIEEIRESATKVLAFGEWNGEICFYPDAFARSPHEPGLDPRKVLYVAPDSTVFEIVVKKLLSGLAKELVRGCLAYSSKFKEPKIVDVYYYTATAKTRAEIFGKLQKDGIIVLVNGERVPDSIISDIVPLSKVINVSVPEDLNTLNTEAIVVEEVQRIEQNLLSELKEYIGALLEYKRSALASLKESLINKIMLLEAKLADKAARGKKRLEEKLRKYEEELKSIEKRMGEIAYSLIDLESGKGITSDSSVQRIARIYLLPEIAIGGTFGEVHSEEEAMFPSAEVELTAMQYVMEYERKAGRIPKDVSLEYLGYDIESKDPRTGEIRYIEVKGRAGFGGVALTVNEWATAAKLRSSYHLYVVWNIRKNPQLVIIQDPVSKLTPKIQPTYFVPYEELVKHGEKNETKND